MTTEIKVVQHVASLALSAGGPTRTVTSLCSAMGRMGAEVALISTKTHGENLSDLLLTTGRWVDTTFVDKPSGWIGSALSIRSLSKTLEKNCRLVRPTLLHDNGIWLAGNHAASAVARATRVPLIITTHGMLEPWAFAHRAWKKRIAWLLYQRRNLQTASVLHVTAPQEVCNLRRLGLQQPIAIIPNGVEFPAPADVASAMASRLDKVEAPNRQHVAMFLGRIHPVKGLSNLIEAWALSRPVNWKLVIAGPDESGHLAEVAECVSGCGLGDQVSFVGAVDGAAKADLYRNADLFVLPTFSENFGVVVAEALSYGIPVITTKGAPWPDLEKHHCGWWVDIGIAPLASALKAATSLSDEERFSMGERAIEYVKRYNWDDIASKMIDVYRWMLNMGSKPDCVYT